jgi:hypothetical protein
LGALCRRRRQRRAQGHLRPRACDPLRRHYLRALLTAADDKLGQALLGYNHSPAYVNNVPARTRAYVDNADEELVEASVAVCADGGIDAGAGPAELRIAERVSLQGEAANHREVRRSRAGVLSVAEKARRERVRCGSRRRAQANHR